MLDRAAEETRYPRLMCNASDLILLMIGPGAGTVVSCKTGAYKVGHWSDEWHMNLLYSFYGTVALTPVKGGGVEGNWLTTPQ